MDFKTAVQTVVRVKYFDFNGRASRSEYWFFTLFWIILSAIVGIVGWSFSETAGNVLSGILSLVLFLPSLGVAVRRLHDRNKSGLWLLIILIPLLGGLILLFWFVQRGTIGSNNYGPDPLEDWGKGAGNF